MNERRESSQTFLTMADVRQWLSDKASLESKIKTDQESLARINRKLDAAALLMPEESWRQALASYAATAEMLKDDNGDVADALDRGRMTADVADLVNRATKPMKPGEIRVALRSSGYREQLSKNPNYLYTVISRLTKSGRISKYGAGYGPPRASSPRGETEAGGQPRSGINPEPSAEAA
jgi:hypothetical protein